MSKEMSIIALGVWVIIMPYLGIYRSWLTILMVLTGIALMIIGFLLRGKTIVEENHSTPHNNIPRAPRRPRKSHVTFEESVPAATEDYSSADHSTIGSLN
jgi:hypothetical protein